MSQITIIGLGLVGSSLGLAIKRHDPDHTITGHDKDRDAVVRAKKMGAIDASHWNLISACENADMIILSIPAAGIAPTLEAIRQDLKPGCLIMDTASVKAPVLEAARVLPENVYFIGSDPVLGAVGARSAENASADLFEGISWALCPTPATNEEAVRVAANLVTAIGAQPFFLDATEHDGLMAAAEGMPTLLSAAVVNALSRDPAWREIRRMAGGQFEIITHLPDFEAEDLSVMALANAQSTIHWIDQLMAELEGWKEDLREEDGKAVAERFANALEQREKWLSIRGSGDWEELEPMKEMPSLTRRLLGIGRPRKK